MRDVAAERQMRVIRAIVALWLTVGCSRQVHPDSEKSTVHSAIQAVSKLHLGMSETEAKAAAEAYGIHFRGTVGGGLGGGSWCASAILSDKSQLVLDFKGESNPLSREGSGSLTGWRVHDPDGHLLTNISRYKPPDVPPRRP